MLGSIAGGLATAAIGGLAGRSQAKREARARERAMRMADPFFKHRGQYGDEMNDLMDDPSSVMDSPGYEYRLDQGLEGVSRGMGAAGQRLSGRRMAGLMDFGQSFAADEFDRQFNRLGALSGATNGNMGQSAAFANQTGAGRGQQWQALGAGAQMIGSGLSGMFSGKGTTAGQSMMQGGRFTGLNKQLQGLPGYGGR